MDKLEIYIHNLVRKLCDTAHKTAKRRYLEGKYSNPYKWNKRDPALTELVIAEYNLEMRKCLRGE